MCHILRFRRQIATFDFWSVRDDRKATLRMNVQVLVRTAAFIQSTMHLIKTSNIQTLF